MVNLELYMYYGRLWSAWVCMGGGDSSIGYCRFTTRYSRDKSATPYRSLRVLQTLTIRYFVPHSHLLMLGFHPRLFCSCAACLFLRLKEFYRNEKNFEKKYNRKLFFYIINRSDIIITRVRESRQKNRCGTWFCRLIYHGDCFTPKRNNVSKCLSNTNGEILESFIWSTSFWGSDVDTERFSVDS